MTQQPWGGARAGLEENWHENPIKPAPEGEETRLPTGLECLYMALSSPGKVTPPSCFPSVQSRASGTLLSESLRIEASIGLSQLEFIIIGHLDFSTSFLPRKFYDSHSG